jgi:DNA-binding response OmpR family regulator
MRKLPRVLVVEDEPSIAELIAVNLRHNGFAPTVVYDGAAAQREVDAVLPDLILLDWMLPGESGASLARQWRKSDRTKAIPIIMLTARSDESHSRSTLLDKVWGDHVFIEERTVDVHVKRLRESLGEAGSMVETVRGAGYRLTAQGKPVLAA